MHLFTPAGQAALVATMAARPLLAFDFDGTLAPIVSRAADALVPRALEQRLNLLSCSLPMAVVSGRSVADLQARLTFKPHFVIGNHGAEEALVRSPEDRAFALDEVRRRMEQNAAELAAAGVVVEDKKYSIALHYRGAPDREAAFLLISACFHGLGPEIAVFGGKLVVNVVASASPNKAHAVTSLVERCGAQSAVFVGDDINDEPVFASARPGWLTVRVGHDDPESRARFYLNGFDEVVNMLDRMIELLDDPG